MKTVRVVTSRTPATVSVDMDAIPAYQSDAMCRTLVTCITRLFEIPAVREDYEKWLQKRQQKG